MNPTRTIELWLANDEGLYSLSQEWARDSTLVSELAGQLRDYFEELASEVTNPVLHDLLTNALSEVAWYSIADDLREEHYVEEVHCTEDDENENEED